MMLAGAIIAFAQQPVKKDTKGMKHMVKTEKAIHHERTARDKDMLHGRKTAARTEKSRLAESKEKRNREAYNLKKRGIKHPVLKADKKAMSKNSGS